MSTVNYSLKHKGVRLISSENALIIGKNGSKRLNPKYHIIGKIEMTMPNKRNSNHRYHKKGISR